MAVASTLDSLLNERDNILKDIEYKQSEILFVNDGSSLNILEKELSNKISQRTILLNNIRNLQNELSLNTNTYTKSQLLNIEEELISLCTSLSELDKSISESQTSINNTKSKLLSKGNDELEEELNDLLNKLSENTESVGSERERARAEAQKENEQKDSLSLNLDLGGELENGYQKIWIDEAMGIYMMYDKVGVISSTMKTIFKSATNIDDSTLKNVGLYQDKMFQMISQTDRPGLPTLMSAFIDLIVKAVGNFGKNFFAFKNTIDLLAGFQLDELLGNAIPGLVKVISDLKLFLTDTGQWIFKNMFSPMYDINIPIPSFKFDLGALIPFLPFKIPIPCIDPFDFLGKGCGEEDVPLTPLNINADQSKIPMDWREQLVTKAEEANRAESDKLQQLKNDNINNINNDIQKLLNDLNNNQNVRDNINKDLRNSNNRLQMLLNQYNQKETRSKLTNLSEEEYISLENDMSNLCKEIEIEEQRIIDLKNKLDNIVDLSQEEKENIQGQINELKEKKNTLDEEPIITSKEYRKLAAQIAYEQNVPNVDLDVELKNLYDIGVNIFDNDNLMWLQKIGHNFKDTKHFDKLNNLKSMGIQLNNSKLLKRLYDIGFSLNDTEHLLKLDNMKKYGISVNNTKILNVYLELGFNMNHKTIFTILKNIKDLGLDLNDYELLVRLNSIGFNFNNPYIVDRMVSLRDFVDIKNSISYDNAISRNVNLNNPYFIQLLKNYNKLNLNFNSENFHETEADILTNVKVDDIDEILSLLTKFKTSPLIINSPNYYKYYDFDVIDINDAIDFKDSLGLSNSISSYGLSYNTSSFYKYRISILSIKQKLNKYINYGIYMTELEDSTFISNINGTRSFTSEVTSTNIGKFENQLRLLREFVFNQGWVVNVNGQSIRINENLNEEDMKLMAASQGLDLVTNSVNTEEGEVTTAILSGVYGNFDKIGLNLRDPDYQTKFITFQNTFNHLGDGENILTSGVILNTKRNVKMITKYYKNKKGKYVKGDSDIVIDLSTQKPDPELFEEGYDTELVIENVLDPSVDPSEAPTQTIAKFDSMNQIGFNFQKDDYATIINKFGGLDFDINEYDTVNVINALVSIGFHLSDNTWQFKLQKLIDIGFKFRAFDTKPKPNFIGIETADYWKGQLNQIPEKGEPINIDVSGRLESLINLGFNFSKNSYTTQNIADWEKMLKFLKNVGINITNIYFENAISELNAFGINFNDTDWYSKTEAFKKFNIDFSEDNWQAKMSNLRQLGIDFNDDDWEQKVDKTFKLKTYGIAYDVVENREKLAELLKLGLDFDEPEDVYKAKLESLVDIGIVIITNKNAKNKRSEDYTKYNKEVENVILDIQQKEKEIDGRGTEDIDALIRQCESNMVKINNKLETLKKSLSNSNELEKIENDLYSACEDLSREELRYQELLARRNSILKDIESKGIDGLTDELNDLLELKNNIEEPKSYNEDNYKIVLTNLEKIKKLDSLNVNFYDPNWKENHKKLADAGLNFGDVDWKDKVPNYLDMVKPNPILEWIKTLISIITNILSMPLKTLFEIIKKLVELITAVLDIPLNPVKIPEWAKNIIKKFKDFIKLIISLPTLDGILDFLFMSTAGLALIDIFIPGFATVMEQIKEKIKSYSDELKELKKKRKDKEKSLSKLKEDKAKKLNELQKQIDIKKSLLNGETPNEYNTANRKIAGTQQTIMNNMENIKQIIENGDISKETIESLENELELYCKMLSDLDDEMKENNEYLNNMKNLPSESDNTDGITKEQLEQEVLSLENELNELSNDNTVQKNESELKNLKEEEEKLEKKSKIGGICDWNKNANLLRKITDEMKGDKTQELFDLQVKMNSIEEDLDEKNNLLYKNQLEIDSLNNGVNPKVENEISDLEKSANDLNELIESLEQTINDNKNISENINNSNIVNTINNLNSLIQNNYCISKNVNKNVAEPILIKNNTNVNSLKNKYNDELDKSMSNLDKLKELKKNLDASIASKNNELNNGVDELLTEALNKKDTLSSDIEYLENEYSELKSKYDDKEKENTTMNESVDKVLTWINTILGIVCGVPKFVVNIIIGILNAVGYMEYLPTLWEFPYVD